MRICFVYDPRRDFFFVGCDEIDCLLSLKKKILINFVSFLTDCDPIINLNWKNTTTMTTSFVFTFLVGFIVLLNCPYLSEAQVSSLTCWKGTDVATNQQETCPSDYDRCMTVETVANDVLQRCATDDICKDYSDNVGVSNVVCCDDDLCNAVGNQEGSESSSSTRVGHQMIIVGSSLWLCGCLMELSEHLFSSNALLF